MATPRGIRNANPGNIERNATKWQGMARDQSGDPRFVVFTDAKYGIRAIAKTILTYYRQYQLNTVNLIIGRWAPAGENDTKAYADAVAKAVGVDGNAEIDVDSVAVMLPLVAAIIRHENGQQPYTEDQILEGLHLAGIADADPPPVPAPVIVAAAPAKIETQKPIKSRRVWGFSMCSFVPLVLAFGPFALRHIGMSPDEATQAATALAGLLAGTGAPLGLIGSANANIKPLG